MTESELLANDTFIGLCGRWEADRHCPFPMIDFCLERDWPEGAEAARWAVETEKRKNPWCKYESSPVHPRRRGNDPDGEFVWWAIEEAVDPNMQSDDVPIPFERRPNTTFHDSFPAAIAFYLVNFDPVIAAKYPPTGLPQLEVVHAGR